MTLREFLLQNAPRDEIGRRRTRDEWVAAVDRLLAQIRAWLVESDSLDLLDLEPIEFERREQHLGAYQIRGLVIHFGERIVKVLPVGRYVLADLGPYAEPGRKRAEGRVDISNDIYRYLLFRKITDAGDQWFVQDERAAIRPLDRAQFEIILKELLS
jgi:hypothetical protein